MKQVALLFAALLLAGAGCLHKPVAPKAAASEPCAFNPTPLLVGRDLLELCVPPVRQPAVERLQNATRDLEDFAAAALDRLDGARAAETQRPWRDYEQARRQPANPPRLFQQALDAAKDNVTVINATWDDVKEAAAAVEQAPADAARTISAAVLARSAANVTQERRLFAASLGAAMAAGTLIGGMIAVPLMVHVRKKAAYWGAFSDKGDVQRRQRLLGFAGLGCIAVGMVAAAALLVLRWA